MGTQTGGGVIASLASSPSPGAPEVPPSAASAWASVPAEAMSS